jgi:hypothetical protein
MDWLSVIDTESHHILTLWITLQHSSFCCPLDCCLLVFLYLFLINTSWNSTTVSSAHSMDHHLIFSCNCFYCKSCQNVQVVQANYVIFAWKMVKQEKDSGVQGGTLLLEIFLGSSNISKVERVSVPILTDEVSLETISFFLVANSLLVLMSSLKANSLLITGKMFANIPSLHADEIDMAQKNIEFVVWMCFLGGGG